MRECHGPVLRELATWCLASGRSTDLDLAAFLYDHLLHVHGPAPFTLDRPDIEDVAFGLRDGGVIDTTFDVPDDRFRQVFTLIGFLWATDRIGPGSAPLDVLLEPARCVGGLDQFGDPHPPHSLDDQLPCQCLLPFEPALPLGTHQHYVGRGSDGRRFAAAGLVVPRSTDPPVSKLQPLHDYLRMLRRDDSPWDIWSEDLHYAGEVFATKDSPALSAYRLDDVTSSRWAPLLLDRTGRPWSVKQHRGRKVGYRWIQVSTYGAVHRAGIADYLLRVRPRPPHPNSYLLDR